MLPTKGSGIVEEALKIAPCQANNATHFILCHGSRIKFIIELKYGITKLQKTIATYNKKLTLLVKLLPILPWKILQKVGLGYFARVELHQQIESYIPAESKWNVLVGTYDEVQKLVFQCYTTVDKPCTFIKVGNKRSDIQMQREIEFLRKRHSFSTFRTPTLLGSALLSEGCAFNIQVTKEHGGKKVPPVLTEELFRIATEIAGPPIMKDGTAYSFSHGDFAPWNIRKDQDTHTVFDWELCGLRPVGYDAAYFIIMADIALNKCNFDEAFQNAAEQLQRLAPNLKLDKALIQQEFTKTTKTLNF